MCLIECCCSSWLIAPKAQASLMVTLLMVTLLMVTLEDPSARPEAGTTGRTRR
jgi:hypothetical protein